MIGQYFEEKEVMELFKSWCSIGQQKRYTFRKSKLKDFKFFKEKVLPELTLKNKNS